MAIATTAKRLIKAAHKCLLPHEENNHVPHVLRHRVLFGYSVIMVLVKALVVTGYLMLPAATVYSSAVTAQNVLNLTNAARNSAGVHELSENSLLARAALAKAEDMIIHGYFSHTSPDGKTPWDWIRGSGYNYRSAGENLAVHYYTAEGTVEGWMASPSHRANIIDERYTETGIGVARGQYEGADTVFVVQMFGRPKVIEEPNPEPTPEEPAEVNPPAEPEPVEEPLVMAAMVTPTELDGEYEVQIEAPKAEQVTILLGQESTNLELDKNSGAWQGEISIEPETADRDGEILLAHIETPDGPKTEPVMLVAPQTTTQEIFVQEGEYRPFKLFGIIKIKSLEDTAYRFYVLMYVVLGVLLLISVLAKFEKQRRSTLLHALFVIALSLFLAII